ncbi:MAG: hypothetical protein D6718_10910 [Acidobacteria bacterium]|nr:MAG: hypothetical protein D6718_10910 [Acidobacteriota bacterium]
MRHLIALCGALLVVAAAACSGQKSEPEAQAPAAMEQPAESAAPAAATEAPALEVGQALSIEGTMGCGHCTFHKTDDCAAAVQTADGRVFILDVGEDHELFTSRTDGKAVRIEGTVVDAGDPPHLTVTNYSIGS